MPWPRRKLVTILDSGTILGGTGPGGGTDPPPVLNNAGVWYRADRNVLVPVSAAFNAGNSEYLSVATNSSLRLGTTPWTVGGWVYLTATPGNTFTISKSVGGATDWAIFEGSGYLIAHADGVGDIYAPIGWNSSLGWLFVVLGYDGAGTLSVQANLGSVYSGAGLPSDSSGGGIILGGANWSTPGAFMTGYMQNWFMFARWLDGTDRAYLYNSHNGRRFEELSTSFKTGLRAWWTLNEASGTRMDSSGNGNHLTDNNTVPGVVAGMTATGSPVADNTPIGIWGDSGPNDFDLSQGTAGSQPTFQLNERNDRPVIRFDGVDDRMITAAMLGSVLAGPQAQTVFLVQAARTLTTNAPYSWDSSAGASTNELAAHLPATTLLYYITGDAGAGTGYLRIPVAPQPWMETWHVVEMVRDGTSTLNTITVEGNATVAGDLFPSASFNTAASASLVVGGRLTTPMFQGDIAELIIFNRVLTTVERDAVRNYLQAKWGIAQNKLIVDTAKTGYVLVNSTTNDRVAVN